MHALLKKRKETRKGAVSVLGVDVKVVRRARVLIIVNYSGYQDRKHLQVGEPLLVRAKSARKEC